jgi:hypothetical protein
MNTSARPPLSRRRHERGSALLLAMALVLAIAVIGAAILKISGNDRILAGRLGLADRSRACAEAGIQYGRRFFGSNYEASNGWNDYLSGTKAGYRYVPSASPDLDSRESVKDDVFGDADGDGTADFWVSIRDDDDETPLGQTDNQQRDNNEVVILRSECINPAWQVERGAQRSTAVIETVLAHVQGSSGYGNAQITSNSPDVVGERPPAAAP